MTSPSPIIPTGVSMRTVVERLKRQAQQTSDIHREMAEAKSLRQGGNTERRTDLYMWPTPEQTTEGRAAALIEELVEALEGIERVSEKHTAISGARSLQVAMYAISSAARAALAKAHHPEEVLK